MTGSASRGDVGRRDRKKRETRQALRDAAHQLFAARGFAQTTIEDITAAADVSRRTFFRYYSAKEDLLRTDLADLLPPMLDALRARPADEPPLLAVLAALRSPIGPDGLPALGASLIGPDGLLALGASLAGPATGLRARLGLVRLLLDWEQGIADTLLARRGLDPAQASEPDRLSAVVTACAATSALRSSVQLYRNRYPGAGSTNLVPIIEQAFAVLAGGCPEAPGA